MKFNLLLCEPPAHQHYPWYFANSKFTCFSDTNRFEVIIGYDHHKKAFLLPGGNYIKIEGAHLLARPLTSLTYKELEKYFEHEGDVFGFDFGEYLMRQVYLGHLSLFNFHRLLNLGIYPFAQSHFAHPRLSDITQFKQ